MNNTNQITLEVNNNLEVDSANLECDQSLVEIEKESIKLSDYTKEIDQNITCSVCFIDKPFYKHKNTFKILSLNEIEKNMFDNNIIPSDLLVLGPCMKHNICIECLHRIATNYDSHPINNSNSHIPCQYPFGSCITDIGFTNVFDHSLIQKVCKTDNEWNNYMTHANQYAFPGFQIMKCHFTIYSEQIPVLCNSIILVENDAIENAIIGNLIIECNQNEKCRRRFCYFCKKVIRHLEESCYDCKLAHENENPNLLNYFFNKNTKYLYSTDEILMNISEPISNYNIKNVANNIINDIINDIGITQDQSITEPQNQDQQNFSNWWSNWPDWTTGDPITNRDWGDLITRNEITSETNQENESETNQENESETNQENESETNQENESETNQENEITNQENESETNQDFDDLITQNEINNETIQNTQNTIIENDLIQTNLNQLNQEIESINSNIEILTNNIDDDIDNHIRELDTQINDLNNRIRELENFVNSTGNSTDNSTNTTVIEQSETLPELEMEAITNNTPINRLPTPPPFPPRQIQRPIRITIDEESDNNSLTYNEEEYLYKNKDITVDIAMEQILNLIYDSNSYMICCICKLSLYKTEKCNGLSHHNLERCYACGRIGFKLRGLGDHWSDQGINGCFRFDYENFVSTYVPRYYCSDSTCSNHDSGDCKDVDHQDGIQDLHNLRKTAYVYHCIKSLLPNIRYEVYDKLFDLLKNTSYINFLPYKQTFLILEQHKSRSSDYTENIVYEQLKLIHPCIARITNNEIPEYVFKNNKKHTIPVDKYFELFNKNQINSNDSSNHINTEVNSRFIQPEISAWRNLTTELLEPLLRRRRELINPEVLETVSEVVNTFPERLTQVDPEISIVRRYENTTTTNNVSIENHTNLFTPQIVVEYSRETSDVIVDINNFINHHRTVEQGNDEIDIEAGYTLLDTSDNQSDLD